MKTSGVSCEPKFGLLGFLDTLLVMAQTDARKAKPVLVLAMLGQCDNRQLEVTIIIITMMIMTILVYPPREIRQLITTRTPVPIK